MIFQYLIFLIRIYQKIYLLYTPQYLQTVLLISLQQNRSIIKQVWMMKATETESTQMKINIVSPALKCEYSYETKATNDQSHCKSFSIEEESQDEGQKTFQEILQWFQEKHIRRGHPEEIVQKVQSQNKKDIFLGINSNGFSLSEQVKTSSERKIVFQKSSLAKRRNLEVTKSSHL